MQKPDFACTDALAYDIAVALNAWCFEPDGSFNITAARALVAGYESRRPLSAAERGAKLTAQLLAVSRVQRLEVRPTYVAPLVEEMRPLLRNVLGPGIEKKFDLTMTRLPRWVAAHGQPLK